MKINQQTYEILPEPNSNLTGNEKKVAAFLNQYNQSSFNMKQKELAEELSVSEATISRFVKKYNFPNYRSFLFWYTDALNTFYKKYKIDNQKATIQNIIYSYKYAFNDMIEKINFKEIEDLSKAILSSKKIFVFALGSSKGTANEFSANLNKIGISSIVPQDLHTFLPALSALNRKDDLVIFISNNFKNKEIKISKKLARQFSKVALITSAKLSDYERTDNDFFLRYTKISNNFYDVYLSSKQSQLIIVDILFMNIFEMLPKERKKRFNEGMNIISKWESMI